MPDRLWTLIAPINPPSVNPPSFVVANSFDNNVTPVYAYEGLTQAEAIVADKTYIYVSILQTITGTNVNGIARINRQTGVIQANWLPGKDSGGNFPFGGVGLYGLVATSTKLYIAGDTGIWTCNIDGTNLTKILTTPGNGPRSLGLTTTSRLVFTYYNGGGGWLIRSCNLDGSGLLTIVNLVNAGDGNSCSDIATDSNFLYWSDNTRNAIGRSNLDGSSPNLTWLSLTAITNGGTPGGVAVDATNIYWTANPTGGIQPRIWYAPKANPSPNVNTNFYAYIGNPASTNLEFHQLKLMP